jgi:hypothetical protein
LKNKAFYPPTKGDVVINVAQLDVSRSKLSATKASVRVDDPMGVSPISTATIGPYIGI